jgi:hypothetical protein
MFRGPGLDPEGDMRFPSIPLCRHGFSPRLHAATALFLPLLR